MIKKWIGLVLTILLFFMGTFPSVSLRATETSLIRIPVAHPTIIETLLRHSFQIVEIYETFLLTKAEPEQKQFLESQSIPFQAEKDTNVIHVNDLTFYSQSDKSLTSDSASVEAVNSSICIMQWIGPEKPLWKDVLADSGVRFLLPVYKNAWIVALDPVLTPYIRDLRFVQALQTLPNCVRQNMDIQAIRSLETDVEIWFASKEKAEEWVSRNGTQYDPIVEDGSVAIVSVDKYPVSKIPALQLEPDIVTYMQSKDPVLMNAEAAQVLNIRNNADINTVNGLEGEGEIVAFADTGLSTGNPATVHNAFKMPTFADKVIAVFPSSSWGDVAGHGTHVAGSILGTGAGDTVVSNGTRYKGMAPKAKLVSQNVWRYGTTMYQILQDAYTSGAKIHSNSWHNSDTVGQYDYYAYEIDKFQWDNMDFQALFAAGNYRGNYRSWFPVNGGPYSLTSFSASKNSISVGASENKIAGQNENRMAYFSSEGPTTDGRMKPEIVSPGLNVRSTLRSGGYGYMSGTSMATPITSGSLALIREYVRKYTGIRPQDISAALLKALLLQGANASVLSDYSSYGGEPLYLSEHNFVSGWGRTDIRNSLYPVGKNSALYNEYSADGSKGLSNLTREKTYYVEVLDPSQSLKATLVWTDFPGTPCGVARPYDYYDQVPELVNNLDLTIRLYGDHDHYYYGNRFNATGQSVVNPANHDFLNNVETIVIPFPEKGIYEITVSAFNSQIVSDSKHGNKQPYAMVVTGGNIHTVFPPETPFNLSSHTECGSISLHWNAPPLVQYPVKEYILHRIAVTGNHAGEHVTFTIPGNQTAFVDSSIILGTEYWYYVQAINTKGLVSSESNGTLAGYLLPPQPPHPYEPPQVTSERVFWYWNHPRQGSCPIDYYRIFRSTDPTVIGNEVAVLEPESHSFIDTNVVPGTTYYYTFYSVDIVPATSAPYRATAVVVPVPETKLALSVEPSIREICANRSFFLTISVYNQSQDTARDLTIVVRPDQAFTILKMEGVSGISQADGSWKVLLEDIPPNQRMKFQVNIQSNQSVDKERSYTVLTSLLQKNLTIVEEPVSIVVKPCSSSQPSHFYGKVVLNGLVTDPETGKRYLPKGNSLHMVIELINGHSPYQIKIQWGDGETTEKNNEQSNSLNFSHLFESQGNMELMIIISDTYGKKFEASIPLQVK